MTRRLFASLALAVLLCVGLSFSPPPDPVTYYVNKLADPGGDGTTTALTGANCAWDTIADVNAASFAAGDSILISRGTPAPVYREQLTVPSSGSAGLPITFGAYGTGADPIISGADLVTTWTLVSQTETGGLFVADAEDGGVADFTGTTIGGTSTFAAGTVKNNGTYGYTATSDGTNNAFGYQTIASQNDLYVRFYFKLKSDYALTNLSTSAIARLRDGAGTERLTVKIRNATGIYQIVCQFPWGGWSSFGQTAINRDQWYRVEIRWLVHASTGGAQLWLDGSSLGSNFALNTAGMGIITVDTGHIVATGGVAALAGSIAYFDDIKADTSAVGAYSAGSTPDTYSADCAYTTYVVTSDGTRLTNVATTADLDANGKWTLSGGKLYIRAAADPDTVTIEAYNRKYGVLASGKNYITVDGLAFTGHQPSVTTYGAAYYAAGVCFVVPAGTNIIGLTVINCDFTNEGDTAINAYFAFQADPPSGRTASGLTITWNTVNEANWTSTHSSLASTSRGMWIIGAIKSANDNVWDAVTISNNTIIQDIAINPTNDHIHQTNGIQVDVTGGANLAEHNTLSGVSHGIQFKGYSNTSDLGIIRYNLIHDTADDFINTAEPFGAVKVYYNVGYNGLDNGIDMMSSFNNSDTLRYGFEAYNNVIFNTNNAGMVLRKVNNAIVKNNIFMDVGTTNNFGEISNIMHIKDSDAPASNITIPSLAADNNVWYNTSGTAVVFVDTSSGQSWPNFATWKSTYNLDIHSLSSDPLFVSIVTPDFSLQPTSLCINAGTNVGLTEDYTGNPIGDIIRAIVFQPIRLTVRPVRDMPDIGAYEYKDH